VLSVSLKMDKIEYRAVIKFFVKEVLMPKEINSKFIKVTKSKTPEDWNFHQHYSEGLIFIGPCIVIFSYSTTNKTHLLSQIIYSCKTLYMFRTVLPSIIRSSKLRIHVKQLMISAAIRDKMKLIPDSSR
jgi:hypothetical protein